MYCQKGYRNRSIGAGKFTFIHSDNDPYCPLEHAKYLAEKLSGELIIRQGQGHFSTTTNPEYTQFLFLRDLIIFL